MKKKVCLVILDGWGIGNMDSTNAVYSAKTPITDQLTCIYPHGLIRTDGENVGLPDGQMGNSEVGHMNIGAGRIVFQDLVKINRSINDASFFDNPQIQRAFNVARERNHTLHLVGLVSDGGVHSHINHLLALIKVAVTYPQLSVALHIITDGRDTDPMSGVAFVKVIEAAIENTNCFIASVIGRYYAMDRDKRWERVQQAYNLYVKGEGKEIQSASDYLTACYTQGETDEFILPAKCMASRGQIQKNDVVLFWNYRTDRCREIVTVLSQRNMPEFNMNTINCDIFTMTNYDDTFKNVEVIFNKDNLENTLGKVIADAGMKQLRIAETEKYPHVTFFFNGGHESVFEGEERIMVPSPKVATYDLQPEMSAREITEQAIRFMTKNSPDFVCLNYANPDMVGHTGDFDAIVTAIETTDHCLGQLIAEGQKEGYSFVIIADHGNADVAKNSDGSPNTAHSTNPVPIWVLDPSTHQVKDGILADIAPTILSLLGITPPIIMTGKSLIES
jgi:2,3-bisphosphoglycerate-independent phosphoglycerate mutase